MPKRFWWIFIVMIPIGMTLGLLTSAVITYKMPKLYESEGIIEVTSPSQVTPPGKLMKPRQFSEQELGSITGADILERVVDGLELPSKWGMARDEAIRLVKESIQCTLVSEANGISIKVRCRFREDARDIAIAIIKCYQVQKAQPSDAAQAEALSRRIYGLPNVGMRSAVGPIMDTARGKRNSKPTCGCSRSSNRSWRKWRSQ
jgi:hypothetical protein